MTFDIWWNDQENGAPAQVFNTDEELAKAAWQARDKEVEEARQAGYAAGMERAAEIASQYGEGKAVGFIANAIAEAIRRDGE